MNVINNYIGNWIQVDDNKNNITIENYGYDTGIIAGTTGNHCVKCVAVNKCYFKDEKDKKPEPMRYGDIEMLNLILKGFFPGLYHINCHCKELPANINSIEEIQLIIPEGKLLYLFRSKADWVNAMGYYENDYDLFVKILLQKTKEAYFYGNYYKESLSKYGFKINLKIEIPGENEKKGKVYKIETNYMIFSNKKLKMNTPIGGWQK